MVLNPDLPAAPPVVAVVTIVRGRHDHLRGQQQGLAAGEVVPDLWVVAAMGDPGVSAVVDAGARAAHRTVVLDVPEAGDELPLAAARNAGAAAARAAGADVLVFLDVDCIPAPDLVGTYRDACARRALEDPGVPDVVSGPVHYLPPRAGGAAYGAGELARSRPHPARPVVTAGDREEASDILLFWSLSFAMTSSSWDAVGGFDEGYRGYGGEDTDFALLVDRAGGRLWWLRGAAAYHQHHPVESPPVRHLEAIVRNSNRFHERWGFFPMGGWLSAFEADGLVTQAGTPPRWRLTRAGGRSARRP